MPYYKERFMKNLDKIVALLILLGGVNWGLIGLFDFDLIEYVFAKVWMDRLVYALIGLSAVYKLINWKKKA